MVDQENDETDLTMEIVPEKLQKSALEVCRACPELRSVAIIFDWEGDHNKNPEVPMGVWTDEVGPIRPYDIDTIRGSLAQVSKMMASQAGLAIEGMGILELLMGELNQELRKLTKYVDIEKEKAEQAEAEDNDSGDA